MNRTNAIIFLALFIVGLSFVTARPQQSNTPSERLFDLSGLFNRYPSYQRPNYGGNGFGQGPFYQNPGYGQSGIGGFGNNYPGSGLGTNVLGTGGSFPGGGFSGYGGYGGFGGQMYPMPY